MGGADSGNHVIKLESLFVVGNYTYLPNTSYVSMMNMFVNIKTDSGYH